MADQLVEAEYSSGVSLETTESCNDIVRTPKNVFSGDSVCSFDKEIQKIFLIDEAKTIDEAKLTEKVFLLRKILKVCQQSELESAPARSLCWKFLLGYVPSFGHYSRETESIILEWSNVVAKLRKNYNDLKCLHMVDPTADDSDCLQNNPLDFSEGSTWAQFHRDQILLDEINKDLERLFPIGCDDLFVSNMSYREKICNVLFVWCKDHPKTSYRQGMHELAAPILYILQREDSAKYWQDQEWNGAKEKASFKNLLDGKYIEHDLYWMFDRIMDDMEPFYRVTKRDESETAKIDSKALATMSPVLKLSSQIQNEMLTLVDEDLSHHLNLAEIAPQLYTLRWIRLLFGREFHIEDQCKIWDWIFANYEWDDATLANHEVSLLGTPKESNKHEPTSGLPAHICYVAVGILLSKRENLLKSDYLSMLQSLMNSVELDPRKILSAASTVKEAHIAMKMQNNENREQSNGSNWNRKEVENNLIKTNSSLAPSEVEDTTESVVESPSCRVMGRLQNTTRAVSSEYFGEQDEAFIPPPSYIQQTNEL
mmetsp:Transcript_6592/g.8611  ORF Transcript_6592/g.8611 Transcript_6592/m.8611 type:complete len:540 (+) Transcript_6592:321-1940(+)|eukprot:CAMPEP_0184008584 /NCGR_PEP_ID=MMETSP0954-20121128/2061_1 /TAXON_ID=627963 /ORGANISM="Aplanochytrium sp, Strain PBS07" /LENGTH=539 /DNA_ID=CAMNT_0026287723 /DNA_START=219 /DNA_END=1838 /DNA_ORIENTATION=-